MSPSNVIKSQPEKPIQMRHLRLSNNLENGSLRDSAMEKQARGNIYDN